MMVGTFSIAIKKAIGTDGGYLTCDTLSIATKKAIGTDGGYLTCDDSNQEGNRYRGWVPTCLVSATKRAIGKEGG